MSECMWSIICTSAGSWYFLGFRSNSGRAASCAGTGTTDYSANIHLAHYSRTFSWGAKHLISRGKATRSSPRNDCRALWTPHDLDRSLVRRRARHACTCFKWKVDQTPSTFRPHWLSLTPRCRFQLALVVWRIYVDAENSNPCIQE